MKTKIEKNLNIISILIIIFDLLVIISNIIYRNYGYLEKFTIFFDISSYHNSIFIYVNVFFACYVFYFLANKIVNKIYFKEENFDVNYFRENLKKIIPSHAYFLVNMDLDVDKCINADLLKLVCDNVLKIENNQFKIINDNFNVSKSQRLLLKSLENKCSINYNEYLSLKNGVYKEGYKQTIIQELLEKEFIKSNKLNTTIFDKTSSIVFSFYTIWFSLIIIIGIFFKDALYSFSLISFVIGIFFPLMLSVVQYALKKVLYLRTKKGKAILKKVLGLKKFLKEFSNIENSKLDELSIREYYFIYSIIFDFNEDENKKITDIKNNSV